MDLLTKSIEVAVTGIGGALIGWFISSIQYGKKLSEHKSSVEIVLEEHKTEVETALKIAISSLSGELELLESRLRELEGKHVAFREQSNADYAKEAKVAKSLSELMELCQRLLHATGLIEGVLQTHGHLLPQGPIRKW